MVEQNKESKELVQFLTESKFERLVREKRRAWITNTILIIIIGLIGFYIYSNIEEFKDLGADVCILC